MPSPNDLPAPRGLSRREMFGTLLASAAGARAAGAAQLRIAPTPHNLTVGMYAVITGSGAALPVPERGNASQAVVVDGTVLQFDCGRRVMDNLMLAGINPVTVDYIFFTHLHFDHISEYGFFVITCWIAGRQKPFRVFGPRGTVEMSDGAIHGMHKTDVEFVTRRVKGLGGPPMKAAPQAPVEVKETAPGVVLETSAFKVTAAETHHITEVLGPLRSLAYRVDCRHGSVVISGDTSPSENVVQLAKGADLLIHECTYPPSGVLSAGAFSHAPKPGEPSTGHTTPAELGELARRAQVKKLVATHFGPITAVPAAREMSANFFGPRGAGPEVWPAISAEVKKNYPGPLVLAEDALVIRVE